VGTTRKGQLVARFYDPQAGAIRLGGTDLRQLQLASLRSRIGIAFEDSFLFSDSIGANIAYGRPDATRDEIAAAARIAGATGTPEDATLGSGPVTTTSVMAE
jgi:ATP-binding cassette subfamily B protein